MCLYIYIVNIYSYIYIVHKKYRENKEKSKRREVEEKKKGKDIKVYVQNSWYTKKVFLKPNICKTEIHHVHYLLFFCLFFYRTVTLNITLLVFFFYTLVTNAVEFIFSRVSSGFSQLFALCFFLIVLFCACLEDFGMSNFTCLFLKTFKSFDRIVHPQ